MATVVASRFEPQPMFEPRARILYAIIGAEIVVGLLAYYALGMTLSAKLLGALQTSALAILAAGLAARRGGFPRIAEWLEATALIYVQGLTGWVLLFPATAIAHPFADSWLSLVDRAVGFNFAAFHGLSDNPVAIAIYQSFDYEAALIVPVLTLVRRDVWRFALALSLAMVLTVLIYPFAPAVGPSHYYGLTPMASYGLMIEAVRDHGARFISESMMVAMVSFPSFHAATAAIFAWAMWPVRVLRWPFVALNVAVCLTAIPCGDHYLADILGGLLVAWTAISISGWLNRVNLADAVDVGAEERVARSGDGRGVVPVLVASSETGRI